MWIVIVYACFTGNVCAFIDSQPVYSQAECQAKQQVAEIILERDPRVLVYDSKCIHIQMSQG